MLFEFRVDCDITVSSTSILTLVGMLFEFRVDCDFSPESHLSGQVGMLFEFRVDCDFF